MKSTTHLTITDSEVFGIEYDYSKRLFRYKESSRVAIFNERDEIALLKNQVEGTYSIPGGSIELGESPEATAIRESLEEVGAKIINLEPVVTIHEIRYREGKLHGKMRKRYFYKAQFAGKLHPPKLTKKELKKEYITEWYKLDRCIDLLETKFNKEKGDEKSKAYRDLVFMNMMRDRL